MDGPHVLGPVQVGLVGRQHGEHATHDGDGGDRGAAEGGQVDRRQGPGRVGDALSDEVGQATEDGDSAESEQVERISST